MNLGRLVDRIGPVGPGNGDHLVMVIDRKTGKVFTITGVTYEHHYDADGSTTVWLDAEEY